MLFFKKFFKTRFWETWQKVVLIILFTFIPLMLNIIIAAIPPGDRLSALFSNIIPGEMLAYCVSFIAPLFFLFLNSHGSSFKIPALKFAFLTAFIIYLLATLLMLIAKNGLIRGIDFNSGHRDLYFFLAIICLILAILLRLYTAYQDSRFSDFKQNQNKRQQDFNNNFQKRIDQWTNEK